MATRKWVLYREITIGVTILLVHKRPNRDDSKGFVYSFTLRSGLKSRSDKQMEGVFYNLMDTILAAYVLLVSLEREGDETFKFR